MEVSINYGYNILDALREFKQKIKKEIEILTTMTVQNITIVAKGIHMEENKDLNSNNENNNDENSNEDTY